MSHIQTILPPEAKDMPQQNVIVGGCLHMMRHLADSSVEMIITSPPYNNDTAYRSYNDKLPADVYLDWIGQVSAECARILSPSGSLFLNIASSSQAPDRKYRVLNAFSQHFALQNEIAWIKSQAIDGVTRGHSRPVRSARYLTQAHETVYHLTLNGAVPIDRLAIGVPYANKSNIHRWRSGDQDLRCAGNVWYIPYETRGPRGDTDHLKHPAIFPIGLPDRCIRLHGRPGLVLDPFCGTGTTLVAARRLGLPALGIDIDPEYARSAQRRIAAEPPFSGGAQRGRSQS